MSAEILWSFIINSLTSDGKLNSIIENSIHIYKNVHLKNRFKDLKIQRDSKNTASLNFYDMSVVDR